MLTKRFNHNDPYFFKPDNLTVGTFEYYKRKFGSSFPDWKYEVWECLAKLEGEEQKAQINIIMNRVQEEDKKLLSIFEEEKNIITNNNINE
jgi:hypothetical protein